MSQHLELAFVMFVLLFITSHLHSATHSFEKYEQKRQMSTEYTTQYLRIVWTEKAWKNSTVVILLKSDGYCLVHSQVICLSK